MNDGVTWYSDCVYYDAELRKLRSLFKETDKVFKDISKRAERRQTVQCSKSLFDYYERKADFKVCPQKYFDFRMDEYRICMFLYKGFYSVLCVGFAPLQAEIMERKDFVGAGCLFGKFKSWKDCEALFRIIVSSFVRRYIADYDDEENVPF